LRNCSPCLPEINAKKQRMNDSFAAFFRFYAGLGKAWLDFVQSKPVFSQNTSSSLDFVQAGGGFSAFSPKFHVSRWIKSTLANDFFLFRFLDWTKSSIGLPPLELSSFLRSLSFCNRSSEVNSKIKPSRKTSPDGRNPFCLISDRTIKNAEYGRGWQAGRLHALRPRT